MVKWSADAWTCPGATPTWPTERDYIPHFLLWGPNELHPDVWAST
jgi:hypothetical protein